MNVTSDATSLQTPLSHSRQIQTVHRPSRHKELLPFRGQKDKIYHYFYYIWILNLYRIWFRYTYYPKYCLLHCNGWSDVCYNFVLISVDFSGFQWISWCSRLLQRRSRGRRFKLVHVVGNTITTVWSSLYGACGYWFVTLILEEQFTIPGIFSFQAQ